MFEVWVSAEYLVKNPSDIEDYWDFVKVITLKRYQYLSRVEPEKAAELVPSERVKEIDADYEAVKDGFSSKHQWHQKPMKEMASSVGAGDMYDWFYCSASSIHHGNMEALGINSMRWEKVGDFVQVVGPSLSGCASALAVTDALVLNSLQTVDAYLGLGCEQRIEALKEKSKATWARRTKAKHPGH